jgi:adenylate kinase
MRRGSMKVIVCTGISGSERREYLSEIKDYAKEKGKDLEVIDLWRKMNDVTNGDIDEATILNLPNDERMMILGKALNTTVEEIKKGQKESGGKCVLIAAHACFHWKTDYLKAIPDNLLKNVNPDILVTIIHNLKDIKRNLDENSSHRFVGTHETDILYWQNREIEETHNWADSLDLTRNNYVVARNEPAETLYRIIFEEERKKIYFSYPMSYSGERDEATKLIGTLREMGYIVFDPASIDDVKYVEDLVKSNPDLYEDLAKNVDDQTVKIDYLLIDQSDMVIVRYPEEKLSGYKNRSDGMYIPLSVGVICEMVHGHYGGKRVYALWLPEKDPSPFFEFYCKKYFRKEKELLEYLAAYVW